MRLTFHTSGHNFILCSVCSCWILFVSPPAAGLCRLTFTMARRSIGTSRLRKCQATVNEISALYPLTILISAVLRYTQTPPILEVVFINNLLYMQIFIIFTTLIFKSYDSQYNKIPTTNSDVVYNLGNLIAQLATSYTLSIRHSAFPILYEAGKSCSRLYDYVDVGAYFTPSQNAATTAKTFGIGIGITIGGMIAFCVLFSRFKANKMAIPNHPSVAAEEFRACISPPPSPSLYPDVRAPSCVARART